MNLRGLFGSMARQMTPFMGDADAPAMSPAPAQMAPAQAPRQPFMTPTRRENWAAKAYDVGAIMRGQEPTRMAAQAKAERMEQLRTMAEPLFEQNPSARVLFEADPERFASLLEESLKPYTMTGGQVRRGGFGAPVSQSKVEQFGDVYANVDPMSGRVTYSDPRPQTYSERETARSNRADEALGQGRLGVSQAQLALEREKHKARQAAGGYGTPGGGAGGLSGMTNEQLLEMLRR